MGPASGIIEDCDSDRSENQDWRKSQRTDSNTGAVRMAQKFACKRAGTTAESRGLRPWLTGRQKNFETHAATVTNRLEASGVENYCGAPKNHRQASATGCKIIGNL